MSDFNFQVVQPEWNSSPTLWTCFGLLRAFKLSGIVPPLYGHVLIMSAGHVYRWSSMLPPLYGHALCPISNFKFFNLNGVVPPLYGRFKTT